MMSQKGERRTEFVIIKKESHTSEGTNLYSFRSFAATKKELGLWGENAMARFRDTRLILQLEWRRKSLEELERKKERKKRDYCEKIGGRH